MGKRSRTKTGKVPPCEACGSAGWLLAYNTDRHVYEIQRCDACERFKSDEAAGRHATKIVEDALGLRRLVLSWKLTKG